MLNNVARYKPKRLVGFRPDQYGYLKPAKTGKAQQSIRSNLNNIFVVVGCGSSDIGKGWLAGSLASLLPNPLILKIDPVLKQTFDQPYVWRDMYHDKEGNVHTSDFCTYEKLGLKVEPDQNLLLGKEMAKFLKETYVSPLHGVSESKKLTNADLTFYFAKTVMKVFQKYLPKNIVIEVGGTVNDLEQNIFPGVIRLLGLFTGITPKIIGLTRLDYIKDTGRIGLKTQGTRQSIRDIMSRYAGLPLSAMFVRRGNVPKKVPSRIIEDELYRIAYETQYNPNNIIFEEDVSDLGELRNNLRDKHLAHFLQNL